MNVLKGVGKRSYLFCTDISSLLVVLMVVLMIFGYVVGGKGYWLCNG